MVSRPKGQARCTLGRQDWYGEISAARRGRGPEKSGPIQICLFILYHSLSHIFKGERIMSTEQIDYKAIIADLEEKRAAIDNAIASLRKIAGLGTLGTQDGTGLNTSVPFGASGAGEVPDGAFHGKTLPEAIKLYLELMHKKQSPREIIEGLKKGGMESTSKYFGKIVYATLTRLKGAGDIVKVGSEWGLPAWYPALMRAGISSNGTAPKTQRKAKSKFRKTGAPNPPIKSEPSQTVKVENFLRVNPGPHTAEDVRSAISGSNTQVVGMLLGKLAKRGIITKLEDGKYQHVT